MAFKINCPDSPRTLNVTGAAFGKTVPCPGCSQSIKVPLRRGRRLSRALGRRRRGREREKRPRDGNAAAPLPPGMPPMPEARGRARFLTRPAPGPRLSRRSSGQGGQRLDLADMFAGNGEGVCVRSPPRRGTVDELTIHHQHLFVVSRASRALL